MKATYYAAERDKFKGFSKDVQVQMKEVKTKREELRGELGEAQVDLTSARMVIDTLKDMNNILREADDKKEQHSREDHARTRELEATIKPLKQGPCLTQEREKVLTDLKRHRSEGDRRP